MTIIEALKESKENGLTYSCPEYGGWIKYDPFHSYHFPYHVLISDNWYQIGKVL